MNQMNVLVLFGGCSPEHDVSMESAPQIIGSLSRHNIIPVYITRAGKWLLYDGKPDNIRNIDWEKFGTAAVLSSDRVNRGLLRIVGDRVKVLPVDVVFPALHGANGEDGTIQGLCEFAGIPYVGCGVLASALAMDKAMTNRIADSLGIPQANYLIFHKDEVSDDLAGVKKRIGYKIKYPLFVKPATGGSSLGCSKVKTRKELEAAIHKALEYSSKIVVERAIVGREIECAVLGEGKKARISEPGEVIHSGEFYDYNTKYHDSQSKNIIPAELGEGVAERVKEYALKIFKGIDGKGQSRVDFFVTDDGKVLFNEINTIPGYTPISMYMKLWEAAGISSQDLVEELISIAVGQSSEGLVRDGE